MHDIDEHAVGKVLYTCNVRDGKTVMIVFFNYHQSSACLSEERGVKCEARHVGTSYVR